MIRKECVYRAGEGGGSVANKLIAVGSDGTSPNISECNRGGGAARRRIYSEKKSSARGSGPVKKEKGEQGNGIRRRMRECYMQAVLCWRGR